MTRVVLLWVVRSKEDFSFNLMPLFPEEVDEGGDQDAHDERGGKFAAKFGQKFDQKFESMIATIRSVPDRKDLGVV
jgi:hypothetical protein